jgi:hypothetical protein
MLSDFVMPPKGVWIHSLQRLGVPKMVGVKHIVCFCCGTLTVKGVCEVPEKPSNPGPKLTPCSAISLVTQKAPEHEQHMLYYVNPTCRASFLLNCSRKLGLAGVFEVPANGKPVCKKSWNILVALSISPLRSKPTRLKKKSGPLTNVGGAHSQKDE